MKKNVKKKKRKLSEDLLQAFNRLLNSVFINVS